MAEIVDVSGKRIEPGEPLPSREPLEVLKSFIATCERSNIDLESVYLLVEFPQPNGKVVRQSYDSGITAAEALVMLECEKTHLIKMLTHG